MASCVCEDAECSGYPFRTFHAWPEHSVSKAKFKCLIHSVFKINSKKSIEIQFSSNKFKSSSIKAIEEKCLSEFCSEKMVKKKRKSIEKAWKWHEKGLKTAADQGLEQYRNMREMEQMMIEKA